MNFEVGKIYNAWIATGRGDVECTVKVEEVDKKDQRYAWVRDKYTHEQYYINDVDIIGQPIETLISR